MCVSGKSAACTHWSMLECKGRKLQLTHVLAAEANCDASDREVLSVSIERRRRSRSEEASMGVGARAWRVWGGSATATREPYRSGSATCEVVHEDTRELTAWREEM